MMYKLERQGDYVVYQDNIESVEITIPTETCVGLIYVEEPPAAIWPESLDGVLHSPIGCPALRRLVKGHKRIAIIVPDATRGAPVASILPVVVAELEAGGIRLDQITVVVAVGVHRPATDHEIAELLGSLTGKIKIINHDPFDRNGLVYLGTTSHGTPVEVNRIVQECDFRIAIGKVEPHEFAGFSGGRKSVLPGIASERTIEVNHRVEMLLEPKARAGVMEGNPISEDMTEAASMLGIDFIVNVVQGMHGETLGVFAGALEEAHHAAISFVRSFCQVALAERADIVVTTPGKPLNIDFYQSLKAIIALENVVVPGGAIVLYSACSDGVGTSDMFKPYEGAVSIADVIANLKNDYKIQMDHALLVGKVQAHGIRVIATSPNVPGEKLEKIMFQCAWSPQEALDKAMAAYGQRTPRILFYPQPQRTLPQVSGTVPR